MFRRYMEADSFFHDELKSDLRMGQRQRGNNIPGGSYLARHGTKKFPARRGVEKEAANSHGGPRLASSLAHVIHTSSRNPDLSSQAILWRRHHRKSRHRCDRRKCLTTKPKGGYPNEIRHVHNLTGGVSIQREHGIFSIHANTVIAHLKQRLPPAINDYADMPGFGIESVFDEFFDRGGRTLDHLSRRYLVGDGVGENLDSRKAWLGHPENLTPSGWDGRDRLGLHPPFEPGGQSDAPPPTSSVRDNHPRESPTDGHRIGESMR